MAIYKRSRRKVLLQLESHFGMSLEHKKPYIYQQVTRVVNEQPVLKKQRVSLGHAQPTRRRRTRGEGRRTGLQKPRKLSPSLADFVGQPEMARTEVVKFICSYIKENDLQDPADRRRIILDEPLKKVLNVEDMSYFTMQKLLNPHIAKGPKAATNAVGTERTGRGFNAVQQLSPELAALVEREELTRCQVVKQLWTYIKANKLQDPTDGRQIVADAKFRAVFKVDRIHMMTMNKELSKHLTPKPHVDGEIEMDDDEDDDDIIDEEFGDPAALSPEPLLDQEAPPPPPLLPDDTPPPPLSSPPPAPAIPAAPAMMPVHVMPAPVPGAPMANVPVPNVPVPNMHVPNVPLSNVPMTNVPVSNVPVTNVPVSNVPVPNVPVPNVHVPGVPVPGAPGMLV